MYVYTCMKMHVYICCDVLKGLLVHEGLTHEIHRSLVHEGLTHVIHRSSLHRHGLKCYHVGGKVGFLVVDVTRPGHRA